ncbi:MAG: methyltransferase domain-containing protein [Planctomycetota bacterium]
MALDRGPITDSLARRARGWSPLKAGILWQRRLRNRLIDRWLGIDTTGVIHGPRPGTQFGDQLHYECLDYRLQRKYLAALRIGPQDVVIDVGCGLGRVLCACARMGAHECIGIEYDATLAAKARENARTLRGRRSPIAVRVGDAVEADYSRGTVIWMFNPFGEQTMKRVLARIEQSLAAAPRTLRICYVNPVHEALLAACGWLHYKGTRRSPFFSRVPAKFWSNSVQWTL